MSDDGMLTQLRTAGGRQPGSCVDPRGVVYRRIVAITLAVLLCLGALPMGAGAAAADPVPQYWFEDDPNGIMICFDNLSNANHLDLIDTFGAPQNTIEDPDGTWMICFLFSFSLFPPYSLELMNKLLRAIKRIGAVPTSMAVGEVRITPIYRETVETDE